METTVVTTTPHGISAKRVDVEAGISAGLPEFHIVGLPDMAVRESRLRIRHAVKGLGLQFPDTKITVNLAPANLRKSGGRMDLAIAMAVLEAAGLIPKQKNAVLLLGELTLHGDLRAEFGVLSSVQLALQEGIQTMIVPQAAAAEASLIKGIQIYAANTLEEVINHFTGKSSLSLVKSWKGGQHASASRSSVFAQIRGQAQAKRALEIAAAGGHNLLFIGPPGSGKTLLARALPELLPELTHEEALEVSQIESSIQPLPEKNPLITRRPVRSPHHTASVVSLVGGGVPVLPGEVTRAHRGVLFLDELPEFPTRVLETLRQPLEDQEVTITRSSGQWVFPSCVMLVAAMNPCPCGFAGEVSGVCICTPAQRERYRGVLSGPLIDRIDLVSHVPRILASEYFKNNQLRTAKGISQTPEEIVRRVRAARRRQSERKKQTGVLTNSELGEQHRTSMLKLGQAEEKLLSQAAEALSLSARGMNRVLKVARTIADLEGRNRILVSHISEALQFRKPPK